MCVFFNGCSDVRLNGFNSGSGIGSRCEDGGGLAGVEMVVRLVGVEMVVGLAGVETVVGLAGVETVVGLLAGLLAPKDVNLLLENKLTFLIRVFFDAGGATSVLFSGVSDI